MLAIDTYVINSAISVAQVTRAKYHSIPSFGAAKLYQEDVEMTEVKREAPPTPVRAVRRSQRLLAKRPAIVIHKRTGKHILISTSTYNSRDALNQLANSLSYKSVTSLLPMLS